MTATPPQRYRDIAEDSLRLTKAAVDATPTGMVSCAELAAHSAKAQVFATVAVAQALLEIGDVLRQHLAEGKS